jgi:hypothetical protein
LNAWQRPMWSLSERMRSFPIISSINFGTHAPQLAHVQAYLV